MVGNEQQHMKLNTKCYLDLERELLVIDDWPCSLSRLEFRLLYRLGIDLGHVIRTNELISYMWGGDDIPDRQGLYVIMNRLRKKLEKGAHSTIMIICIRDVGYFMEIISG